MLHVLKLTVLVILKHTDYLFSCNIHIQLIILFTFCKLKVFTVEENQELMAYMQKFNLVLENEFFWQMLL
jgi:hypothetical protein